MTEPLIKFDVRAGYLGWSNWRAGLEFYRNDGDNSRWKPRDSNYGGEQKNGLLLQDDIEKVQGLGEGCACVVITCGTRDLSLAHKIASELFEAFQRDGVTEPPHV